MHPFYFTYFSIFYSFRVLKAYQNILVWVHLKGLVGMNFKTDLNTNTFIMFYFFYLKLNMLVRK